MKKLHIGCGHHPLPGWLNTDVSPEPGVTALDATQPFPFPDGAFSRIFSEHVIEHVPFEGGAAMLRECFRVLSPGGRIRISTPSFAFLLGLLHPPLGELQRAYVAWATGLFYPAEQPSALLVVNNFVRAWGHQLIYDEPTLVALLRRAGFTDVAAFELGRSDDPELRDLENHERLPPGFLQLETMTLEATRP